jgi:hypothetical protein
MTDAPPPEKKDSLDPFREMIRNPAARVYLAVAAGGLGMTALIVFQLFNSSIGAAVTFAAGLLALLLRWTAMPVFIVVIVGYTVFAPFGVPIDLPGVSMIPGSQLRLPDMLLVASLLTYLLAQYRLLSILHAAVPFEAGNLYVRKRAKAAVRPPAPVSDAELGRLFLRVGVFTLVGQLLWMGLTWLQLDFREIPPVTVLEEDTPLSYIRQGPDAVPRWLSRTLLAVGLFVALGVAVRFAFWFWRHHTLGRDQAKMLLTDLQWAEHLREIDRQEKWRAWMVDKLNGTTKPRSGCGTLFMVVGLPAILLLVFWLMMMASGCVKS